MTAAREHFPRLPEGLVLNLELKTSDLMLKLKLLFLELVNLVVVSFGGGVP